MPPGQNRTQTGTKTNMSKKTKELVIISGKGGTGKTSIVASFAALAEKAVLADCDVDAADLHLVLAPRIRHCEEFSGGNRADVITEKCAGCFQCADLCRFGAMLHDGAPNQIAQATCRIDPIACEGCGLCARFCPAGAVSFAPAVNGHWFVSDTRFGPMVHAELGIAEENSGKLVSTVRNQANRLAEDEDFPLIIADGSPGVGCPVIASVTNADLVLIVAEPTLSGLHDLKRVVKLTEYFKIETLVCVNKWDLSADLSARIEDFARAWCIALAGMVRYDPDVTLAQVHGKSVVEYSANGVAADVRKLWSAVADKLK